MSRRALVVGNWKMHKTPAGSARYLRELLPELEAAAAGCDVAVAPGFLALSQAREILADSAVHLAAQNAHWEDEGPFTGEVSAKSLSETGCRYVIVGHSERREKFGETDRCVNRKARAVLFWKMTPIVCVGEKREEREAGRTLEIVAGQVRRALANLRPGSGRSLVVAYEPVWAIGADLNATPSQAAEVHERIRAELVDTFGGGAGRDVRVIYGGSVTPDNAAGLLGDPGIDGVLVGGASLDGPPFLAICRAAVTHMFT